MDTKIIPVDILDFLSSIQKKNLNQIVGFCKESESRDAQLIKSMQRLGEKLSDAKIVGELFIR